MLADEARAKYYGNYLDEYNLFMPLGHLMPIMQQESNNTMHYRGLHINQHPCDAWVYQEIIYETQPELIIEIGAGNGGSSLWLEDMIFNCVDKQGGVLSIDLEQMDGTQMQPFMRLKGNSEDRAIINEVREIAIVAERVMVIDDCAHTFDNVLANLKNYGPMVTKGCYYIVEDTILGHGVDTDKEWSKSDTPMPAVMKYLKENDDFEMDRSREKFFITACPRGFLRKVK